MTNSMAAFLVEMGNEVVLPPDLRFDLELELELALEEEVEVVVELDVERDRPEGLESGHRSSNLDNGSKTATGSSSS